jgi:hypothetical protein
VVDDATIGQAIEEIASDVGQAVKGGYEVTAEAISEGYEYTAEQIWAIRIKLLALFLLVSVFVLDSGLAFSQSNNPYIQRNQLGGLQLPQRPNPNNGVLSNTYQNRWGNTQGTLGGRKFKCVQNRYGRQKCYYQ